MLPGYHPSGMTEPDGCVAWAAHQPSAWPWGDNQVTWPWGGGGLDSEGWAGGGAATLPVWREVLRDEAGGGDGYGGGGGGVGGGSSGGGGGGGLFERCGGADAAWRAAREAAAWAAALMAPRLLAAAAAAVATNEAGLAAASWLPSPWPTVELAAAACCILAGLLWCGGLRLGSGVGAGLGLTPNPDPNLRSRT